MCRVIVLDTILVTRSSDFVNILEGIYMTPIIMSSEERRNIELVQIIKKYPCIYDSSILDYPKRNVTEKAWCKVANEAKLSVSDCKTKWKNLRTAYTRSQRIRSTIPSKNKKRYYLSDVMEFIAPFIKPRINWEKLPSSTDQNDCDSESSQFCESLVGDIKQDESETEIKFFEADVDHYFQTHREEISNKEMLCFREPNQSQRVYETLERPRNHADDPEKYFSEFSNRQNSETSQSGDLDFFKSLLPDLQKLNDRRKRKFKRLTMEMLDNLSVEQEDEHKQTTCNN